MALNPKSFKTIYICYMLGHFTNLLLKYVCMMIWQLTNKLLYICIMIWHFTNKHSDYNNMALNQKSFKTNTSASCYGTLCTDS